MPLNTLIPKTKEEWVWVYRSVFLVGLTWALVFTIASVVATYYFVKDSERRSKNNEELIVYVCRLVNELRSENTIVFIDLGVPYWKLQHLRHTNCSPGELKALLKEQP